MPRLVAAVAVLGVGAALALSGTSCSTRTIDASECDYVVTRCRTVCDYGYYGCYGSYYGGCCYNQCWYECIGDGRRDPEPSPSPSPPPDAAPAPAPPPDAAVTDGPGGLCSPCGSNDDCKAGALCIQPGGDAGATSFCGHPCQTDADCPAEFTCADIGSSRQCLPVSGVCN
jgi:hypothetical protein